MEKVEDIQNVMGVFPTSPSQNRFWYQEQTDPNSCSGNIAVRWEIRGKFRDESIEKAAQCVVERHEVLRTRIVEHDGIPRQEVLEKADFKMGIVDIRGLSSQHREERIDEIARKLSATPFDFSTANLIRITLVRSDSDCAALLIVAHHTVFDGFSIKILGKEIGTVTVAFEEGRSHMLPELQLQYADYALWQEELQGSPARELSAEYWKSQLNDAPYFEVEPDSAGPEHLIRSAERVTLALPDDFGDILAALARRHNTSSFALGAAITAAALQRFCGLSDVSFGTAMSGRDEIELEDLIGVFINPVVLRFQLGDSDTLAEIASKGDKVVQGALANGDYPFEELMRRLKRPRDVNRTPLVSVFFALQRVFLEEQSYGPISIASIASETPQITHDLNIQLLGRASGWQLIIDYDGARFDEHTVSTLGKLVQDTFTTLLKNPTASLKDVPFAGREWLSTSESENQLKSVLPHSINPPNLRVVETEPSKNRPAEKHPTQERLSAIWSEILGLPVNQCDGDFFDLGGHSIIVLRMLSKIHTEFGVRVALTEFLENPTLKGVAASIAYALANKSEEPSTSNWEVIALRAGQPGAPIIVSINQPFLYHNIARKFEDHCRVINLHISNERYFESNNATPVEDIVQSAAKKIETEAAGRPVFLMGQCVDGLMGLAIAQALENAGIDVLNLAMVDTWAPNSGKHFGPLTRRRRRLQAKIRRWRQYTRLKAQREIGWKEFLSKSSALKKLLIRVGQLDAPTSTELQERRINEHLVELFRDYQFQPYTGEVILFRTESHTADAITRSFGWDGVLSPDTPVYPLRGWHEDTLLWHGFGRIADVIECRLKRVGQFGEPYVTPQIPVLKG